VDSMAAIVSFPGDYPIRFLPALDLPRCYTSPMLFKCPAQITTNLPDLENQQMKFRRATLRRPGFPDPIKESPDPYPLKFFRIMAGQLLFKNSQKTQGLMSNQPEGKGEAR